MDFRFTAEEEAFREEVAAFCAERGLPYCQATLLGSYAQAIRHLNGVGKLTRPGSPAQLPA